MFAPTDAAFAKLPKELVEQLLADPKLLATVLTYCAVAGQQINLSLKGRNRDLFINSSKVITADLLTSNGVIHVIDTVLIPKP